MFGYVRPLKSELKLREFEQFRACYCALCHTLSKHYGFTARFLLNYDFVVLSMLLWKQEEQTRFCFSRCPASPLKKRCVCQETSALQTSAGISVILTYWKLVDTKADCRGLERLKARACMLLLRPAYRKASRDFSELAQTVKEHLQALSVLEKEQNRSLDRAADQFAQILASVSASESDENRRRVLEQLLYHLGRWIYLVDAVQDLNEDWTSGSYNPLIQHFALTAPVLREDMKEKLRFTLNHSQTLVCNAYAILNPGSWTGILENIFYLGMTDVTSRVFDGTFQNVREYKMHRSGVSYE